MSYARALRCRKCGQEYPLQPLSLCDFCLSPLEVSYDYKAMAREQKKFVAIASEIEHEVIPEWR